MAIGEYLNEVRPEAGLLPSDVVARAHCRAVCGEIHSGFVNLRSALPMNLKAKHRDFKVWAGAQADVDRIVAIWQRVPRRVRRSVPVRRRSRPSPTRCTRRCARASAPTTSSSTTRSRAYCDAIFALPAMREWIAAAEREPDELEELDVEF